MQRDRGTLLETFVLAITAPEQRHRVGEAALSLLEKSKPLSPEELKDLKVVLDVLTHPRQHRGERLKRLLHELDRILSDHKEKPIAAAIAKEVKDTVTLLLLSAYSVESQR